MEIVDYSESDGGETLVLRADAGAVPLNALRFETRSCDFQRRVTVESSADGEAWTPQAEGLFFDLSSRYDFRRDRIDFSPTDARWFRVRMESTRARNGGSMDVRWGRTLSLRDFPGETVPRVDRIVGILLLALAAAMAVWIWRILR